LSGFGFQDVNPSDDELLLLMIRESAEISSRRKTSPKVFNESSQEVRGHEIIDGYTERSRKYSIDEGIIAMECKDEDTWTQVDTKRSIKEIKKQSSRIQRSPSDSIISTPSKRERLESFEELKPPDIDISISTHSKLSKKLRIIDCRPVLSAQGNAFMGKGFESVKRLGGVDRASIEFMGIANIHSVKDSYRQLRIACLTGIKRNLLTKQALLTLGQLKQQQEMVVGDIQTIQPNMLIFEDESPSNHQSRSGNDETDSHVSPSGSVIMNTSDGSFLQALHDSKWLHHISNVSCLCRRT
jgi:hypothetical protein